MDDYIRSDVFIALKLPSGTHKVLQLKPGKYGTFGSSDLIGRPFYHTYDIIDGSDGRSLRIVSASELLERDALPEANLSGDQPGQEGDDTPVAGFEIVDETGKVLMKTNQNILDQAGAQKLTTAEIEELKKAESASGRDIIAKILESHSEIDKKTAFSLAKYTTRKASKYLRRFIPLPLDVNLLAQWWLYEKDSPKIMDLREEMLALALSWSNVHFMQDLQDSFPNTSTGRWLVVDETGGLVVAAMAERMGILHSEFEPKDEKESDPPIMNRAGGGSEMVTQESEISDKANAMPAAHSKPVICAIAAQESRMAAKSNTIHIIHSNAQPNLALLTYFNYDSSNSSPTHPLHSHLKSVSWLQLLQPEEDPVYSEPVEADEAEIMTWKSNKRGTFYRKRRRWQRARAVVDETRSGYFDGLIVCSPMTPTSPIRHLVPLIRGGAPIVVYSPHVEPLTELADCYSTARKTVWATMSDEERFSALEEGDSGDFPVDPTTLLNPCIYTARAKPWQVLPGRTHPVMTGMGGPQGYIFTANRVIPIEGERVEARGAYKKRKTARKDTYQVNGSREEALDSGQEVTS